MTQRSLCHAVPRPIFLNSLPTPLNARDRSTSLQNASVFFGCRLLGTTNRIEIGENTNIQDNCVPAAIEGPVTVGSNTVLGHNVLAEACSVGSSTLIGIGAYLARGSVVGDDVMVAVGARTVAGQHLESGWLWAGRPAKPHSRLDDRRRKDMAAIIHHYCAYANAYRLAQVKLPKEDAMGHRLSRIVTRTGDLWQTSLANGLRVDKDSPAIETLGAIDELNSWIGVLAATARNEGMREALIIVQHDLFDLGAQISMPGTPLLSEMYLQRLEDRFEEMSAGLGVLKELILPGGAPRCSPPSCRKRS